MNNLPQISEAEYEIMCVIWDKYPINTNEITKTVLKSSDWNERTIHTLISRLDKKGVISHEQKGKLYYYTPIVKKEDYIKAESKSFLKKFYGGTVKSMVMNLIENDMVTDDELTELRNMLNKR